MIDILKYIPKDTFLHEYMQWCKNNPTSQLADFWGGLFNIATLIHNTDVFIGDTNQTSCINMCFISNNPLDYQKLMVKCSDFVVLQSALCTGSIQLVVDYNTKRTSDNIAGIFLNINDLEDKERSTIRDHFIFTTKERKKYDRYYLMSCMFGCNINDYVSILGAKNEKTNGLLANTIPVFCGDIKRKTENFTETTRVTNYFGELIQYTEKHIPIGYTNDGLQQYSKWCTNRIPFRGYYGQILDNIMNIYCLKVAACLAANEGFNVVSLYHIKNAQKILEVTCKEALKMFEEEMNLDNSSTYIKVLEKIKKELLIAGNNGIQHRSLYLKTHHDIDNDTFKYLITILHELGFIEKLKVSHNSIIYRACDTLATLNIKQLVENIELELEN